MKLPEKIEIHCEEFTVGERLKMVRSKNIGHRVLCYYLLKLGEFYLGSGGVYQFIQVTPKGYNILSLSKSKCIMKTAHQGKKIGEYIEIGVCGNLDFYNLEKAEKTEPSD